MRKNYLAILSLTTVLSMAVVPVMTSQVQAADIAVGVSTQSTTDSTERKDGNFKYVISDGAAVITGLVNPDISKSIDLVIPEKIGSYVVKEIAEKAFEGNTNIKSVKFNEGLEEIGRAAFKNCVNLSGTLDIPSTVTWIQGGNLDWSADSSYGWQWDYTTDVSYKGGAFYGTSISGLNIAEGNKKLRIGASAFESCVSLEKVTLPNRVTEIDEGTFKSDSGLTTLSFAEGNNAVVIGKNAFKGCSNLDSISWGKGISEIGQGAFGGTAVESVTFPDTVKTIGESSFAECKFLTAITLNEGLKTIGRAAFKGCSMLEGTIVIPSTVEEIQGGNLDWSADSLYDWKWDYTTDVNNKGGAFYGTGIEELVIKKSTVNVTIGASAFENCKNLKKVTLANRCTDIAEGAFNGDIALTDLTLSDGNNNLTIGKNAFRGNVSLKELKLCSSVKSIGEGAFYGCTALESLTLNEGLETIGYEAFAKCYALSGALLIPSTVTKIEGYNYYGTTRKEAGAFYATAISSVEIADGNAGISIGEYAFEACTSLASASLSNRVSSIAEGAFADSGLVWVKISNGNYTMTIGDSAFSNCENLKVISLPKNVATIGKNSFRDCVELKDVYYAGTEKQYNALCSSVGDGNTAYTSATWHYSSLGPDVWPSVDVKNGLAMDYDGEYYYYVNGKVDRKYSGLYYDAELGWWLVLDGKVAKDYNDLYCDDNYGWWLITDGTVNFGYTGLYNSPTYGWWLIGGGAVAFYYNDLWNDANCGWWKISNGAVDFGYTGLYNSPTCGWWLIGGGAVAFYYNDLWNDANCGWWKISNGAVDFGYTGLYDSPTCGWWLIGSGSIAFYYNDWWNDATYGTWYVSGGTIDFSR